MNGDQELIDVLHAELDRMRGKLCGLVEAVGMPERQERAAIQLIKSLSYDTERAVKEELYRHRLEESQSARQRAGVAA